MSDQGPLAEILLEFGSMEAADAALGAIHAAADDLRKQLGATPKSNGFTRNRLKEELAAKEEAGRLLKDRIKGANVALHAAPDTNTSWVDYWRQSKAAVELLTRLYQTYIRLEAVARQYAKLEADMVAAQRAGACDKEGRPLLTVDFWHRLLEIGKTRDAALGHERTPAPIDAGIPLLDEFGRDIKSHARARLRERYGVEMRRNQLAQLEAILAHKANNYGDQLQLVRASEFGAQLWRANLSVVIPDQDVWVLLVFDTQRQIVSTFKPPEHIPLNGGPPVLADPTQQVA